MKNYKRFFLFLLYVIYVIGIYGHGKEGHVADMNRIFPFDIKASGNLKIRDFYYLINAYIDYNDFPNKEAKVGTPICIKNHPKFGKMIFANHRIWFHWGFNKDPKQYQLLYNMVEENISHGRIKASDRDEFWNLLHEEVRRRNKYLMDTWAKILGYSGLSGITATQRAQARAFVTILYSIHILGDHQTSEISVLADKRSIYGDIYNAIDDLVGKAQINREKAKSFKNKLKRVQGNPKLFLDKMEKEFTPFLFSLHGALYDYQNKFRRLGYVIK